MKMNMHYQLNFNASLRHQLAVLFVLFMNFAHVTYIIALFKTLFCETTPKAFQFTQPVKSLTNTDYPKMLITMFYKQSTVGY